MTNTELIKDIKNHSLAILKSLENNIVYKVTSITLIYSEEYDLTIDLYYEGFRVSVWKADSADKYFTLEYRDGKWVDE